MSVLELVATVVMLLGSAVTLLAAVGVVRMPDVYARLTATSKAAPFGVGLVLAGAALVVRDAAFAFEALAVAGFIAITAPVSAHAIGRAASRLGLPVHEGTHVDDGLPRDDDAS